MKILLISHKIPYPPNKGDRIPTFYRTKFLSKNHEVSLAFPCFHADEFKYVDNLKKYCKHIETALLKPGWSKIKSLAKILSAKPLTLNYFHSNLLQDKIVRLVQENKFDLIYVYSSSMGQYAFEITNVKKIIDLADSDSHKWLQYSHYKKPPLSYLYYLEWYRLQKYERLLATNFDHSIAISEDEKNLFKTYIPNLKMSVVPNGVNLEYFKPNSIECDPYNIIFVGAMDYYANIDAVLYFYNRILSIIKKEIPNVKFYIVGSNPCRKVRKLNKDENVTVTGFVDDVRYFLCNSSACVAPMRIARGIQNKILEAMASGVPVVTTTKGNEGINAKIGEEIYVENNPEKFADHVIKLIIDKKLRKSIGNNGRKFVEKKFNWEKNMNHLEEIITRIGKN